MLLRISNEAVHINVYCSLEPTPQQAHLAVSKSSFQQSHTHRSITLHTSNPITPYKVH